MKNVQHKKAEIGFLLLPMHWGKGIMRESIPLVVGYGFEYLDLHRIEGFVETENLNSKKTLQEAHFMHEGTMRECEIKHGRLISLEIYARLKA